MILRSPQDGTRLLIPQPAHALLSGQMMAAWGAPASALPAMAARMAKPAA
jgi:hypothetical protein